MKVLFPTDFSECSLFALETALSQHWPDKTEFQILYVAEPVYVSCAISSGFAQPLIDSQIEHVEWSKEMMKKTVSKTKSKIKGDIEVTGFVEEGNPAGTIIDKAKSWDADLIVVGSHGRSGLDRFLMGSVAEKVVAHAPCSVAVVKTKKQLQKGEVKADPRLAIA